MRLAVLASGSRGNAVAVEHDGEVILVDAGLSGKQHAARMAGSGLRGTRPVALLLSHEHSDHVSGAGVVARRYGVPVFGTEGTLSAVWRKLGRVPGTQVLPCGTTEEIGPFEVTSFSLPHDAADPSGYVIACGGVSVGIATDLGCAGPLLVASLRRCAALVLEFNHDEDMLWGGSYPWPLKQRIASSTGHLSNDAASELLASVAGDDLSVCVLAHLSQENNRPDLAETASRRVAPRRTLVMAGMQDEPLEAVTVR